MEHAFSSDYNIAFGVNALSNTTAGDDWIAIGRHALVPGWRERLRRIMQASRLPLAVIASFLMSRVASHQGS